MSSVGEEMQGTGVQVILTPKAVEEVLKFMAAEQVQPDVAGLRVSVLPGGCSGFKYSLNIEERPGLRRWIQPAVSQRRDGRLRQLNAGIRFHLLQPQRDRRLRLRQQLQRVVRPAELCLQARRSLSGGPFC